MCGKCSKMPRNALQAAFDRTPIKKSMHTVNVDFIRFEYVVLAKY